MVTAIQFTQEQARALAGVSAETIRHWRKAVPYLAAKPGKSARFTFPDILGLAVTRELVATFGVHIATVGAGVDALFRVLDKSRPGLFVGAVAVVGKAGAMLVHAEDLAGLRPSAPVLLVPCDPLVARMRDHVLPMAPGTEQGTLPFPPQVIRSGR